MIASTLAAALLLVAGPSEEPLDRALAAVDPVAIEADLAFLTDPELGGRGTGSAELEAAALYVTSRVRRLGLEPGSSVGFRPRFPLLRAKLDLARSSARVSSSRGNETLELGRDLFLRGVGDRVAVQATGEVVGVGDGSNDSLEAAGDLSGAWALIADSGRKTTTKIRRAMAAGAVGVLLTPGPDYDRDPYPERYRAATARAIEGNLASPLSRVPSDREGPPVLLVPRLTANRLAARAGVLPAEWVEAGRRSGLTLSETRAVVTEELSSPNVAALLPGHDPARAHELIVLCAHLDHLGRRGADLYPGADDNASGSVGLLALAEALIARGPLDRSVLFLWVTGEEAGLWGSAAWCADPQLPEGLDPTLAFNLDMIGRDDPEELWLTPTSKHPEFNPAAALVEPLAPLEGFTHLVSQDSYWSASDHYSFATRLRIPVVYLSSGEHDQYHTPADTADRIDVDKLVRIVRLHLRLLEATPALEF